MITLIAAVARNGVIGNGNTIPWHLPEDFKHFSRTTRGHVVIMGSRTWNSLPTRFRPLPDRINIVVSRDAAKRKEVSDQGAIGVRDVNEALDMARTYNSEEQSKLNIDQSDIIPMSREIFVIGGASIYGQTIGIADRLLISHVDLEPEGDTHFPHIDPVWDNISETEYEGFKVTEYKSRA